MLLSIGKVGDAKRGHTPSLAGPDAAAAGGPQLGAKVADLGGEELREGGRVRAQVGVVYVVAVDVLVAERVDVVAARVLVAELARGAVEEHAVEEAQDALLHLPRLQLDVEHLNEEIILKAIFDIFSAGKYFRSWIKFFSDIQHV